MLALSSRERHYPPCIRLASSLYTPCLLPVYALPPPCIRPWSWFILQVTNFTSSWRNGLAFCALIHSFYPSLIQYSELTSNDIKINCKLAFEVNDKRKIGLVNPKLFFFSRNKRMFKIFYYLKHSGPLN